LVLNVLYSGYLCNLWLVSFDQIFDDCVQYSKVLLILLFVSPERI